MKTAQVRCRIPEEHAEVVRRLADKSGLQTIDVATMLLHAALEAVKRNGGKINFPPSLCVETDDCPFTATAFRINEPKHTKK